MAVPIGGLHRVQELLLAAALMGTGAVLLTDCVSMESGLELTFSFCRFYHLIPGLLEKAHGWWWWWPRSQVTSVSSSLPLSDFDF